MEKKSRCISTNEHTDRASGWIAMFLLIGIAIAAAFILLAM